ncbi:MAG: apolipoprotein N-acyltransferase [Pyrinomonadaceae bacterium]|nr:apolipoprotein N-acyltransferase [Pyrinomonadaceae bacterium]MCX7639291.1 apolipoprotein N-acyltransferase [Pyrinomonadaceae bacterium]MDW8303487.1 apolipoprotein N-acyltransferase [Acidobacteriota bacterium]
MKSLLTLLSALLLVFAFPDFERWWIAWIALVPFFWVIYKVKDFKWQALFFGWIWGTLFFFGSCWWLTYALIHYGGIPAVLAYLFIFLGAVFVGFFKAIFAFFLAFLLSKYGVRAVLVAPFLWVSIEFLRFQVTGNNWNAIAYSQAFVPYIASLASVGGIWLVGFLVVLVNSSLVLMLLVFFEKKTLDFMGIVALAFVIFVFFGLLFRSQIENKGELAAKLIVLQPNVPMSGLDYYLWEELKGKHIKKAEDALSALYLEEEIPRVVIFPESPMNFSYGRDESLRKLFGEFTRQNRVSLLFNSAEPNPEVGNFFNSAVMIDERGQKVGQYDKIFLVPFGEYAPVPSFLQDVVPTIVGNFAFGKEFDLFSIGRAKAGVMICFESHFPNLSRQYAIQGADFLIELTNDGYLGRTPVLRQHLANAVFRAVETSRPVVRATNVGITAFITEEGFVLDEAEPYTEAVRIWKVRKNDTKPTFYVKYGDWLAFLSLILSFFFLVFGKYGFGGFKR